MTSNLEFLDASQLATLLNLQQARIHEAHKADSQIDFKKELEHLPQFRNTMNDTTESFLYHCHSSPLNLLAALSKLDTAVNHAMGSCLLKLDLNDSYQQELTAADAYRYKFLVEYMIFLKEYHEILFRHSEALENGNLVTSEKARPVSLPANSTVSPENSGVKGIPQDLPAPVKPFNVGNFDSPDEENPRKVDYEKYLLKKASDLVRVLVSKKVEERGGEAFIKTLTTTGKYLITAQTVGCSLRHTQSTLNGEYSGNPNWEENNKMVNDFLDRLPKI